MNVPDKIYVREYPDGIARFWDSEKKEDVVATIPHEYIRKDALLEWIDKHRALHGGVTWNTLIDKINSL